MAAIYQWFFPEDLEVLTTTLYAAEATDGMEFVVTFLDGRMELIPNEEYRIGIESLSGSITVILLGTGPHDEGLDIGIWGLAGNITKILLSTGPHDEEYRIGIEALGGSIEGKLVFALMPDEGMDITCAILSGSMTPV